MQKSSSLAADIQCEHVHENGFMTVLGEKKSVSWEESSMGVVSHHCMGISFAERRSWKPTLLAVYRVSRSVINWGQEEKRVAEDEMIGWHQQLNGCEFEQIPIDNEGQGSLVCCSPWGHKELDMTSQLNNNNNNHLSEGQCHNSSAIFTGDNLTYKWEGCNLWKSKSCSLDGSFFPASTPNSSDLAEVCIA